MADTDRAALSPSDQIYLEKVRLATRRLSSREPSPEDLRQVAQALRDVSSFDVEVPTASQHKEWELVKVGVKRLSVWYMRYLAQQLNEFGTRVSRLGDSLVLRTERLEGATDELEARIGAAEERLARLEGHAAGDDRASGRTDEAKAGAKTGAKAAQGSPAARRPTTANRGANSRPRSNRRKADGS